MTDSNVPMQTESSAAAPVGALAGARPAFGPALRRLLRQPRFLAAVAVLAVAAVGLNAAAGFLQLHFRKQPVPLRVPSLKDESQGIAAQLGGDPTLAVSAGGAGTWVQVTRDEPMNADVERELGTKEHVGRDYLDLRVLARLEGPLKDRVTAFQGKPAATWPQVVAGMRNQPKADAYRFAEEVRRVAPEAVVRVGIYYYTGLVDTVAHVPERCYVADGFEPAVPPETVEGPFGKYPDGSDRAAAFRYIHFEDVTGQGRVSRYVGYLFHVNGAYESDPNMVRARLQSLLEKHGYYAKVELMITGDPREKDVVGRARAAMADFMTAALPDVERALPDWRQVKAGK